MVTFGESVKLVFSTDDYYEIIYSIDGKDFKFVVTNKPQNFEGINTVVIKD